MGMARAASGDNLRGTWTKHIASCSIPSEFLTDLKRRLGELVKQLWRDRQIVNPGQCEDLLLVAEGCAHDDCREVKLALRVRMCIVPDRCEHEWARQTK